MNIKIDKLLFIGLLMPIISMILAYFLDIGVIIFGVLIVSSLLTLFALFNNNIKNNDIGFFTFTLMFFLYNFVLLFLFPPGGGYSSVVLLVPFFVIAILIQAIILNKSTEFKSYIDYYFLILFFVEFVFCILQYTYYSFGFGLKSIVEYEGMIAGTFGNANDLAVILVLFSVYLFINPSLNKKIKWILVLLTFILLIMTVSRFSLVLFLLVLVMFYKGSIKAKISIVSFSVVVLYFLTEFILNYQSTGLVALDRIVHRLQTFNTISDAGIGSDSSIDLRYSSYLYFISNFWNLGLGSLEFQNYSAFAHGFNGDAELIFKNPHSLIVEVGYWQGYLGLILLSSMFFAWVGFLLNNFKILLIIILVSFIPSTVIFNVTFWEVSILLMLYSFYVNSNKAA